MPTTDTHSGTTLLERTGPRPRTTSRTPHLQLDQAAPRLLQEQLWTRMTGLDGVRTGRSGISAPSSMALHLDRQLAQGPPEAFMVGTEFAHLHGDGSGSLHLALPAARAAEIVAKGWAELHPVVLMGMGPPNWVMLYGPRDEAETAVAWQLLEESYAFALGRHPGAAVGLANGTAPV